MGENRGSFEQLLQKEVVLSETVENRMQEAYEKILSSQTAVPVKKSQKKWKAWQTAAAVLILCTVMGTGVYAAVQYFGFNAKIGEADNKAHINFELNYEMTPGEFEWTVTELPEGYEEVYAGGYTYAVPDSENKYISLHFMDGNQIDYLNETGYFDDSAGEAESLTETTIKGMQAYELIIKSDVDGRYIKNLYVFNPDEGYAFKIFGDIHTTMEEMKFVAEHVVATRVGDSRYLTEVERESIAADEAISAMDEDEYDAYMHSIKDAGISTENMIPMGETATNTVKGYGNMYFTVRSAEFVESLNDTNYLTDGFYDYDAVKALQGEDGTLKSVKRSAYRATTPYGADDSEQVLSEEEIGQKFLVVDVTAKRSDDAEMIDEERQAILGAVPIRLEAQENGTWTWSNVFYDYDSSLRSDGGLVYISETGNPDGESRMDYFSKSMDAGDTIEYTLIFIVDEDLEMDDFALYFPELHDIGELDGNDIFFSCQTSR